jgi:hypothetical protein
MFCIWSRTKFNRIDVLAEGYCRFAICKLFYLWLHFLESINSLLLVCRPLGREMSQGLYINLQTFQSISKFFFCVSQASEAGARDSREGRSLARATCIPRAQKIHKKIMSVEGCVLLWIYCWSKELLNCDIATASILLYKTYNLHNKSVSQQRTFDL